MTIWQAIILGLVEGITEFLPVSSTGHLILAQAFMGMNSPEGKHAADAYAIIIQGGAILAVLGLYWKSVRKMILGLLGRERGGLRLFINLLIAFFPAAILGPFLNDWIESHLFFPVPVLAALALGGVWMIAIDLYERYKFGGREHALQFDAERREKWLRSAKTIDDVTPMMALGIGLFQCVAMWPGTSRSMMTIAGGTMLGLRPKDAAEFSFLLGLPTLGGACVFKLAKGFAEAQSTGTPSVFETFSVTSILVGMLVATISAAIAVKWLVAFLNRHGLAAFGVYRLILTGVIAAMIYTGTISLTPDAPSETTTPNIVDQP